MKNTSQTQDDIKRRMLRHVSALWGIKNTDSLDPLVRMLIETLSGELQKTQQEIVTFEKRILERISLLLTPSLLSSPYCSHGICHAQPNEGEQTINSSTSFYLKKKTSDSNEGTNLHFTPSGHISLIKGSVQCLISGNSVFSFDQRVHKSLVTTSTNHSSGGAPIWIGLDLVETETVQKLHLYIDFTNAENKRQLLSTLRNAEWTCGTKVLTVEKGISEIERKSSNQHIMDTFDTMLSIEKEVNNFYEDQFITLDFKGIDLGADKKTAFPTEKEPFFSVSELSGLLTPLTWIRVKPRHQIEERDLFQLFVCLNAFPVLNRLERNDVHRLKGISNMIPIKPDPFEYFLSVKKIQNSKGKEYRQIPFSDSEQTSLGTYSIRKGGIEKIDSRSAKEFLSHLIELIRDEYAVFSGFGQETVGSLIKDLDKILIQISQRVKQNVSFHTDPVHYISFGADEGQESFFLSYWTTNSLHANDLHPGTKLILTKGSEVKADSIFLISQTIGGKKALEPSRHIEAFKYAMLTHNRLITAEDLKAFCMHELGDYIEKVELKKAFITSSNPAEGLLKCTEVWLTKNSKSTGIQKAEWNTILAEAQSKMESRLAMNMLVKLVLSN